MKVIISHDVDHITVWEHRKDMIVTKHIVRNCLELAKGYIAISEFATRLGDIARNKWNNLESLMAFNKSYDIPATFFFGVEKGMGLCYALEDAAQWVRRVLQESFDVGVHGIAFEGYTDIKTEYNRFAAMTGLNRFGMRMHYLRMNGDTLKFLSDTGYLFDTSVSELKAPFKIGAMWEFPVHLMDGFVICGDARWQSRNLAECKEATQRVIETASAAGFPYLTVVLHDRYFSDSFKTWKEWYVWLVEHLKSNGLEFISYRQAIDEMEAKRKP